MMSLIQTSASIKVARDKATSAATWKRPTEVFQDTLASGGVGLRVLSLPGAIPVEGGLPVMVDGKVIAAIGVSGGSADQDGIVAKAGLDAFAKLLRLRCLGGSADPIICVASRPALK
jgi:uncharacterized protein GlcG (DUF336 family)